MSTHIVIETEASTVGLAIEFVTYDCNNDLETFKAKCSPEWGWDDAKKEEVFAKVQVEIGGGEKPSKKK